MYEELVKRLRDAATMSDALSVLLPNAGGNAVAKLHRDAADAIEGLYKMVSADNARAYLDRDDLMNTLMEHKKSFDFKDRYGYYGMGFSEAIKVVAMMYPVYMSEPPKEE